MDINELPETYSTAYIYDPTAPGSVRQIIIERYFERGRDVTEQVIKQHTALLMKVAGTSNTIALMESAEVNFYQKEFAVDALKHFGLRKAQYELACLEDKWAGLKNYRNYRTPFK